ncbi:phosphatase PAP2 family protein [Aspergillus tanneri]|uniref:Phosphatidic acid phosphatase type n=1 Tax=Aspergillus tanneri TaxID=1220188 RepID=A0A5M9N0X6_9EURO|nr:phosphatidic acid phosphatase type [Aspergillus tanneri]KAA8650793.1 phosphatidic acid phosphatase type [Aspergillus tanneri]
MLGFFVALMLTSLLTDIIKNTVGRPRPDLISRCIPRKGTPEDSLINWKVCTQSNQHVLQEGWRSFPSGHSSFSFAGLGYLSFFVSGQMHVYRPRTDLCRCLIALIPFLCALMIAISRLDDYRHDVYDVTCGSILGTFVAYFSYRRYYPALQSPVCDTPHDKEGLAGVDGFARLPGDEEQQVQGSGLVSRHWVSDETYQLSESPSPEGSR